MERLTTADVGNLPQDKSVLTVFTDANTGGILDDLIITNSAEGYLYVVSNAGRRAHDIQHLLNLQVRLKPKNQHLIIRFQGIDEI